MAKIKFDVEAGFFLRKSFRNILSNLKADILYEEPEAIVNVTENKSFLESHFKFKGSNLSNKMALRIKQFHKDLAKKYNKG